MVRGYLERYGVQAALLGVACIWGWAFVVVADAIELYPMYAFLGLAFRACRGRVRALLSAGAAQARPLRICGWG